MTCERFALLREPLASRRLMASSEAFDSAAFRRRTAAALPASDAAAPWVLVSEPALCERYRIASGLCRREGREVSVSAGPVTALGPWQLAQQAGGC